MNQNNKYKKGAGGNGSNEAEMRKALKGNNRSGGGVSGIKVKESKK